MKYLIVISSLLFSGIWLHAQNVGIGTTTPSQRLDVAGAIKLGTTATADTGTIRFNPATMTFEGYDGTQWRNLQAGAGYWVQQGDSLYNVTIPFVGIGTASPSANLDIWGTLKYTDGSQGLSKVLVSDSLGNAQWKAFSADELVGGFDTTPDFDCMGELVSRSIYSNPRGVIVQGNFAYFISGSSLGSVNISDPTNPVISYAGSPGNAKAFDIQGNYMYVLGSTNYFYVLQLSSNGTIYTNGSFNLGGTTPVYSLKTQGSYSYVAGGPIIRVVNHGSPSAPSHIGTLNIPGTNFVSIAMRGAYLYALDAQNHLLRVINAGNPNTPFHLTSEPLGFNPKDIAINGLYAYVVGDGTLQVVDISNPTNPQLLGSVGTNGMSIDIEGNYAYVTTDNNGSMVEVIDISNPAAPVVVKSLTVGTEPYNIDVEGNYAYVVDFATNHLRVLELTCTSKILTVDNATGTMSFQNITSQGLVVGATGPQGPVGPTGATGLTGPTGPVGPPVNATGTENYLAKFSAGGATLGNSVVFEDGGKVGIGTTTPTYDFHVDGTIGGIGGDNLSSYLGNVHAVGMLQHYNGNYGFQGDPHHQVVLGDNGAWNVNYRRLYLKRPGWAYTNEMMVAYADGFTSARKLKQHIVSVEVAEYDSIFQQLLGIDLVRYEFINDPNHIEHRKYIGMIADDMPEEVQMPNAEGIETGDLFAYVIIGIKKLAQQNKEQDETISIQQQEIDELKKELENIKALLQQR